MSGSTDCQLLVLLYCLCCLYTHSVLFVVETPRDTVSPRQLFDDKDSSAEPAPLCRSKPKFEAFPEYAARHNDSSINFYAQVRSKDLYVANMNILGRLVLRTELCDWPSSIVDELTGRHTLEWPILAIAFYLWYALLRRRSRTWFDAGDCVNLVKRLVVNDPKERDRLYEAQDTSKASIRTGKPYDGRMWIHSVCVVAVHGARVTNYPSGPVPDANTYLRQYLSCNISWLGLLELVLERRERFTESYRSMWYRVLFIRAVEYGVLVLCPCLVLIHLS